MKGRIVLWVFIISVIMLGACTAGGQSVSDTPVTSVPTTQSSKNWYESHKPGADDVSTIKTGQQFMATPNFFYFAGCGRPCWLPLYPTPQLISPNKVTDNYPYERFAGTAGNAVRVVCQVRGEVITDDTQRTSDLWNKVVIPKGSQSVLKKSALTPAASLEETSDGKGYYAYGADIWLGNTGNHGIPCGTAIK